MAATCSAVFKSCAVAHPARPSELACTSGVEMASLPLFRGYSCSWGIPIARLCRIVIALLPLSRSSWCSALVDAKHSWPGQIEVLVYTHVASLRRHCLHILGHILAGIHAMMNLVLVQQWPVLCSSKCHIQPAR